MRFAGTLRYMLPWLPADVEEIDELFGGDCWPYGVEPNRPTLEALVTYMADQGLIPAPVPIEKLFVPVGD
jgi:4,5-dihydroxyphthalate decarboxylase